MLKVAPDEDRQEVHRRGMPKAVPVSGSLLTADGRVSGGDESLYATTGQIHEDAEDEPLVPPTKSKCAQFYRVQL